MVGTLDEYYIRPYYHAVCYFGGCMTYLVLEDFKERKISKRFQQVCWYGSVACCLFCVFVKFAWYRSPNPVSMGVALLAAFLDRILWTLFLVWITLACSTGRGVAVVDSGMHLDTRYSPYGWQQFLRRDIMRSLVYSKVARLD
nr:uncharacterized protein LOC129386951 [Dermacentor andersoni]